MRALILADARFAVNERAMLSRLEVGLADEGLRVIHAIPRRVAMWAHAEVFSHQLLFEDRGSPLSRRWRTASLARSIDRLEESPSPVDVVHAFGEESWTIARGLAASLGAILVLEVWRREGVALAASQRFASSMGVLLLTPEATIERALRDAGVSVASRTIPWGVHARPAPNSVLEPNRAKSIVLLGSGRDRLAIERAFQGVARAADALGEFMVFASSAAIAATGLWPRLAKMGLQHRVTLLADLEARRDLLLEGDILLAPESLGEEHTLLLDAMAHGMVVVASSDEDLSVLRESRTSYLVDRSGDAASWAEALLWVAHQTDRARALGVSAWEFVRAQRRASAHVSGVLNAYESMRSGDAIPFRDASAQRPQPS
jgi:glycosyltransferase involved in cell wall biosynthesis